jgi:hypothetical protein
LMNTDGWSTQGTNHNPSSSPRVFHDALSQTPNKTSSISHFGQRLKTKEEFQTMQHKQQLESAQLNSVPNSNLMPKRADFDVSRGLRNKAFLGLKTGRTSMHMTFQAPVPMAYSALVNLGILPTSPHPQHRCVPEIDNYSYHSDM